MSLRSASVDAPREFEPYRLDPPRFECLVRSGALDHARVGLLDGLPVERSHGEPALHRLSLVDCERFVASGALDGEPVELLEGVLARTSPHGRAHAKAIERLTAHLARAEARLRVQLPLALVDSDSEPEPDIALVADADTFEHPSTALLVVEVSASTQALDRGLKVRVYATAGIPVYWVVDVPARTVDVGTGPDREGYVRHDLYRAGSLVPSPAPGVGELDVAGLFAGFEG